MKKLLLTIPLFLSLSITQAQYEDDIQLFITGSVFDGVTSYTEAEAIAAGFDVGNEESEDLAK